MNVFTEYHHGGLFHALQILFEKRLGCRLFCQVGYEWANEGYWNINDLPTTKIQYLDPKSCKYRTDGILYYHDESEGIFQARLNLEQFKKMKFDVIVCTLQNHEQLFRKLRDLYQPKAKLLRLCGNWGEQVDLTGYDGFIDTTGLYKVPEGFPYVCINQEFPLKPFYYEPPRNHKSIKNFMNCLREDPVYQVWHYYKTNMKNFDFKMHGINGDDGNIAGLQSLGNAIRDSGFIFQIKHAGEGFGHVIHDSYSCGRPAIVLFDLYKGKLASKFLVDEYSAIFVDDCSPEGAIEKIRHWAEPERHKQMCKNAHDLFEANVDFDKDERKFRGFLEWAGVKIKGT